MPPEWFPVWQVEASPVLPGSYRPTTLRYASKHCPAAINFYNDRTPADRRIFGVGVAAHAMIQAAIESTSAMGQRLDTGEVSAITLAVGKRMIQDGRTFEDEKDPPLPPDAVWEGRALARAYLNAYPVDPAPLLKAEEGLAVDREWRPIPYSMGARFRLIADLATVVEQSDEESCSTGLVVRDFKSAWSTRAHELQTTQLRAQAVLAWIHHGSDHYDFIRREVINLRTLASYTEDVWMANDGAEQLGLWKEELTATMDALDASRGPDGRYPAAPGGGCIACPYLSSCAAGRGWTENALDGTTKEARAVAYVATKARLDQLAQALREDTDDGCIAVANAFVGSIPRPKRQASVDAPALIAEEWSERNGEIAGLLQAARLGVTQITNVAKVLFPERDQKEDREAWVASMVETVITQRFGILTADKMAEIMKGTDDE